MARPGISTYDRGTTPHSGPNPAVIEQHSTPLKVTGAASTTGNSSQAPPSADTFRDGLSEDMKDAITIDARTFLSNLIKRVARDETIDSGNVLESIENLVSMKCNDSKGPLQEALKGYLEGGSGEKRAYGPLVKLCNKVLSSARRGAFAADIDKHLRPEDPKGQIEFIRYDKLFLAYDWVSEPTEPGTPGEPCFLTIKPDILVVRKTAIKDYKANQAAAKGEKFDPSSDPTTTNGADCRIGLKDVLSYIELKWKDKSAVPQPSQGLKPSGSKSNLKSKSKSKSKSKTASQVSVSTNSLKRGSGVESLLPGKYQKTSTGRSASSVLTKHMVQTGHYAAELLSRGPYATHTYGIKIKYDKVQICWFDRQNTISTTEFSIPGNFALFIASIIAFSRFSLADWGIATELYPNKGQIKYPLDNGRTLRINMTAEPLCHRVSLHGRGTMALRGELYINTFTKPVVVKISYPEKRRTREPDFVKVGRETEHKEHFAEIYYDEDLGPPTSDIRHCLDLETGCERQRRIIVFEPLADITSLTESKHIARVWLHCLKAHRTMWEKGYEHGDISLSNLMYRKMTKDVGKESSEDGNAGKSEDERRVEVITGILHDWDLATWRDAPGIPDVEKAQRTGTIPYIALDIIENWKEPYRRKYRHDLESFGWCLIHICLDRTKNQDLLTKWDNLAQTADSRHRFLSMMQVPKPRSGFEQLYTSARAFMGWLMNDVVQYLKVKDDTWQEPEDSKIWEGVLSKVDILEF